MAITLAGSCWLCHTTLRFSFHGVCSVCQRYLLSAQPHCPRCGLPSIYPRRPCGRCLKSPPPWSTLVMINHYEPSLRQLIYQLKFQRRTELAVALSRLLLFSWLERYRRQLIVKPDLLLITPLSRLRLWRRGFNQTQLLAKPLSRWLSIPLDNNLISTRLTAVQKMLNASKRRQNLRGAFRYNGSLEGRNVALLDDVVTTGSTVTEISNVLLKSGAATVQVWCLCRTLSFSDE